MFRYVTTTNYKWPYMLIDPYIQNLPFTLERSVNLQLVSISASGRLTIDRRYSWNGPDYLPDFSVFMRASLVHDALCQAISSGQLPVAYRIKADQQFRDIAIKDGCPRIVAKLIYAMLRLYAIIKYRGRG